MKTIPPPSSSLREKKRYILYEILADTPMAYHTHAPELHNHLLRFLGEHATARAGLAFLPADTPQTGIIRVNNHYVDHVKAGLLFLATIRNQPVIARSLTTSGILNRTLTHPHHRRSHHAS